MDACDVQRVIERDEEDKQCHHPQLADLAAGARDDGNGVSAHDTQTSLSSCTRTHARYVATHAMSITLEVTMKKPRTQIWVKLNLFGTEHR